MTDSPAFDIAGFVPASVVRRSCVPDYRDRTRYVSCKIEVFAETPDRRRFIHVNFFATFGNENVRLAYSASIGNPPQVGKAGENLPTQTFELYGADGSLDTGNWHSDTYKDYAIRILDLTDETIEQLEIGIAHMIERPFFISVEDSDGTLEKFLIFDPKPDEGIAAQFRSAFDMLRRKFPSGPSRLPASLSEARPQPTRHRPNEIRMLARLLGCEPPVDPTSVASRVVWSRAWTLGCKTKIQDDALAITQLAATEVGPETIAFQILAVPTPAGIEMSLISVRFIDPEHIRLEDDVAALTSGWQFGGHGELDSRNWPIGRMPQMIARRRFHEACTPAILNTCLTYLASKPFVVVLETKNGTKWHCLVMHKEPEPLAPDEFRKRLAEFEAKLKA